MLTRVASTFIDI